MADASTAGNTQNDLPSFAFEQVAAILQPFDLLRLGLNLGGTDSRQSVAESVRRGSNQNIPNPADVASGIASVPDASQAGSVASKHAMAPIFATQGLVFPYNPAISESIGVKYDAVELTHHNESFHVYRGTDNRRISITEAQWTCDTFANAVYALSVIHFFRSYSQMDFGAGRTGRPPSPMWFSAYGNYAYHRVPVLMEKADFSFPQDVDYVGVPEFGSPEYQSRNLSFDRNASGSQFTWLPMIFKVSNISLVVQHSPRYWTNYNLDMYRSGEMLRKRKSFHLTEGGNGRP